ncbi:TrfA family protein [Methylophilus sp. 13]|uniref:plasmid replication initiator TrfA n=1 Tax=Methylophilus sp. 13 TaxID=2781018 RepID=UPI00188FB36D|nr:plasmid replication initiator TrfA [Methylophilus sp. 13]MBF5040344.1 TrfA family protein [Methylophilus sp. 13]
MNNRLPSTRYYIDIFSGRSTHSTKNQTLEPIPHKNKLIPFWRDNFRCIPNEIAQSSLFSAKNRNQPRAYLRQAEIGLIGAGSISFTGEELRQDDQTVWLQLLHLAREYPIGSIVKFTPYWFCKNLGWSVNGKSYIRLRLCLNRMQATSLSITSTRLKKGVSLSMLPFFRWSDEAGNTLCQYEVRIAPELVNLFGEVYYTRIEWAQRLALPEGLSTWLHCYYASHNKPFPVKICTLKRGAGLTTQSKSSLRQNLEIALNLLVKVDFLESWKINGELVHVKRK